MAAATECDKAVVRWCKVCEESRITIEGEEGERIKDEDERELKEVERKREIAGVVTG